MNNYLQQTYLHICNICRKLIKRRNAPQDSKMEKEGKRERGEGTHNSSNKKLGMRARACVHARLFFLSVINMRLIHNKM